VLTFLKIYFTPTVTLYRALRFSHSRTLLYRALRFSHSRTLQSAQILPQSHSTERSDSPTVALSIRRDLHQTRSPPDAISTDDVHWSAPGLQWTSSIERSNSRDHGGHQTPPLGPLSGEFFQNGIVRRAWGIVRRAWGDGPEVRARGDGPEVWASKEALRPP